MSVTNNGSHIAQKNFTFILRLIRGDFIAWISCRVVFGQKTKITEFFNQLRANYSFPIKSSSLTNLSKVWRGFVAQPSVAVKFKKIWRNLGGSSIGWKSKVVNNSKVSRHSGKASYLQTRTVNFIWPRLPQLAFYGRHPNTNTKLHGMHLWQWHTLSSDCV